MKRDWFTVREAAEYLAVIPRTIERACRRCVLPADMVDGRWLISLAALKAARATLRRDLAVRTQKGMPRERRQPLFRGVSPTV